MILQTLGLILRGLLQKLGIGRLPCRYEPPRDEHGYKLTDPLCWYCALRHTGAVWCPHCDAPVDPYSPEAATSAFWMQDPRNPRAPLPDPDDPAYPRALARRAQAIVGWPARERRSPFDPIDEHPDGRPYVAEDDQP